MAAPCRRPSLASSLPTFAAPRYVGNVAASLQHAPRPFLPSCPPQVKERNPNDLNSDVEVGLWLRYTTSDALDEALRAGSGEGEHSMTVVAPPAGHPDVAAGSAAVGMGCPVGGGAAGSDAAAAAGGNPAAMPAGISPQLYASMDADERTAVVFRHLSPALLHFVESALQVCGWVRAGRGVCRVGPPGGWVGAGRGVCRVRPPGGWGNPPGRCGSWRVTAALYARCAMACQPPCCVQDAAMRLPRAAMVQVVIARFYQVGLGCLLLQRFRPAIPPRLPTSLPGVRGAA